MHGCCMRMRRTCRLICMGWDVLLLLVLARCSMLGGVALALPPLRVSVTIPPYSYFTRLHGSFRVQCRVVVFLCRKTYSYFRNNGVRVIEWG